MPRITWLCGSLKPLLGSSTSMRMCQLGLVLTVFTMNIAASSQLPPKLAACRTIDKVRESMDYIFPAGESCGISVSLPHWEQVNFTDPRRCDNFYKVRGMTVEQCPCPDGETFNPISLVCDNTSSSCVCPGSSTTTTAPMSATPTSTTGVKVDPTDFTAINIKPMHTTTANNLSIVGNLGRKNPPVSTEVIIIAGIISLTVIVIVVIVMGVFCWQKRHAAQQQRERITNRKLSTLHHDGYSHSIAAERHEYAEIDERMIGGKHWQHGGSLRAPPLPNHQPPMSPMMSSACPHHDRSDSGLGSADTSFTANYPRRTFQPINPARNIQIGVAYNERSPEPNSLSPTVPHRCMCEEPYSDQEDIKASSDSQYSNSSHPVSVESREIDLREPLQTSKQNYVSKQVYI
ncbi:uncharacterized protein [Watersipora subatra]|uniref:uncharacterized protein isoform X2 n=1 Tax=Watersipora subatra TaxID=2589382 RepID=UPI00355C360F